MPLIVPRAKGSFGKHRVSLRVENSCSVERESSPPVSPNAAAPSSVKPKVDRRGQIFEVRSRWLILPEKSGASRRARLLSPSVSISLLILSRRCGACLPWWQNELAKTKGSEMTNSRDFLVEPSSPPRQKPRTRKEVMCCCCCYKAPYP